MAALENIFKCLFDDYHEALAVIVEGKIVAVNRAFEACLSCACELLIERQIENSWSMTDPTVGAPKLIDNWCGQIGWKLPDGKVERLYLQIKQLDKNSFAIFAQRVLDGVVVREGKNSKLRHQKLESLGMYAGTVAHDLNNVLTGVLGHVSFLRLAFAGSPHLDSLAAIEDGTKRAASLTRQILEFAKGEESEFEHLNLSVIVAAAVNLLEGTLPNGVQLSVLGHTRDLFVHGDESKLSQVVMNLIINARDALNSKGEIGVVLETVSFKEFSNGLAPGSYLHLSVSDNGIGIPKDIQSKIFDPFFTTKAANGTGLGLATVRSIVSEHGGAINFDSEVGRGTIFNIYLPAAKSSKKPAPVEAPRELIPKGTESVLVVDDEASVRMIMQRGLEHLGYKVEVAENGLAGVEAFNNAKGGYDLVILDMIMPKMPGDEVFFKLKSVYPKARVLIASGYASDERTKAVLAGGGKGFIRKPFTIEELAREVRKCLDN